MPDRRSSSLGFGLIGLGGIGRSILDLLAREQPEVLHCLGALVRPPRLAEAAALLPAGARAVSTLPELLALEPSLIVECAGHAGLREYGAASLAGGCDLLTVSSGALSDAALEQAIRAAAREASRRAAIPAGALVGIDGLAAAAHGGLTHVTYTGRKPLTAWRGTAAEKRVDLDTLTGPTVFFEGSAREAASEYPMNANVAATVALAGIGFDRTEVRLIADPEAPGNVHMLEYEGAFGQVRLEMQGRASPSNPKTSMLTALSLWRALLDRTQHSITIG